MGSRALSPSARRCALAPWPHTSIMVLEMMLVGSLLVLIGAIYLMDRWSRGRAETKPLLPS